MGFFSFSSGRRPYKYGKHGQKHYQQKSKLGRLLDVFQSRSFSYDKYDRKYKDQYRAPESPVKQQTTCNHCHSQVPAGSKFCLQCGEKVQTSLFCISCGEKLPAGAKFCNSCGTKQNS